MRFDRIAEFALSGRDIPQSTLDMAATLLNDQIVTLLNNSNTELGIGLLIFIHEGGHFLSSGNPFGGVGVALTRYQYWLVASSTSCSISSEI